MEKTISAADANRNFSQVLRDVREGDSYVVTSHGRPVARIVPTQASDEARRLARETLFARLEAQPVSNIGEWTRDELYERGGFHDDP
jgi:prevent-host-death family protein